MAKEKEEKKKTKRPTAIKRDLQSEKKRLLNKSFKNKVRSAVRDFESALTSKENTSIQTALNAMYALMDKGVKHGIYKPNKANRTKARLAAKAARA